MPIIYTTTINYKTLVSHLTSYLDIPPTTTNTNSATATAQNNVKVLQLIYESPPPPPLPSTNKINTPTNPLLNSSLPLHTKKKEIKTQQNST